MIDGLGPYSAYSDSGVAWLGEVPAHWSVRRNKLLFREINERSDDGSEDLLTVSQYTGVTRRREHVGEGAMETNAESLVGYKRVCPGDLVINIMLAWNGSLGTSPIAGIVSPAYSVFRVGTEVEPRYIHYLFCTSIFTGAFRTVSTGVVDSRLRLYPDVFFRLPALLPPRSEQGAIVRFLNHADRRIRRYVRGKQRLIKLLEEQRQAIIQRAVTRGFNPGVPLKPSGVEWLGSLPEHWTVGPLKHFVPQVTVGIVVQPAKLYQAAGIPCLRSINISRGEVDLSDVVYISSDSNEAHRKSLLHAGDVVVVRTGRAGVAVQVPSQLEGANCIDLLVVRRSMKILSEYLVTYLNSAVAQQEVTSKSVGAIQGHYNTGTLANLIVPVPPLEEQRAILEQLRPTLAEIAIARDAVSREIALLREFRTRLIADVVTGKLDVREAAARLPDPLDHEATREGPDEDATSLDGDDADAEALDPELREA